LSKRRLLSIVVPIAVAAGSAAWPLAGSSLALAGTSPWSANVAFSNQVASSPTAGGGYPVPAGSTAPLAGTCRNGSYDANHSESWIAVKPGTEDLVGSSKFFFEKYSTFYMFHLGAYTILNGKPSGDNIVQGYECVTTGTQNMPPSWTDTTDPNVDFDTEGRAYQTMLPFNAFWGNLHPNGAIDVSLSDTMGASWTKGNGGKDLEASPPDSSLSFGHFEDKQWIAVDHLPDSPFKDRVYSAWSLFNGFSVEVRFAFSKDHGQTFSPATTLTLPQQTGPGTTFALPAVDAAGNVYVATAAFPPCCITPVTLFVTSSKDGGVSFGPWVKVVTTAQQPNGFFPNTRFRDGITESFAASPTIAGHLYMAFEQWDGTNENVYLTKSTNGGLSWSTPAKINDNTAEPTDQFQPSIAAGPNGAVAVAFYDRREACPSGQSILPADVGRTNFCINTSLQAYKDSQSGGMMPVGGNVRISKFTWDPEEPGQHLGGLSQYPCAGHSDPCPVGTGFIGDYFGLAISTNNIYALFTSTHYPSDVTADEGGPVFYQQQVLATVSRSNFGASF